LKALQGTLQPCRNRPETPQFDQVKEFPDAPQHLNADGAEMWSFLGPQLVAARTLQVVDLYSLEQLCHAWQCFRKKSKMGVPAGAAETRALNGLFSEFGITPASRRKVLAVASKPQSNRFSNNGKRV
tara:strand:+ start:16261 stop:16641 length:381 start_codon:yes stop_codon:yes gene_type:complete